MSLKNVSIYTQILKKKKVYWVEKFLNQNVKGMWWLNLASASEKTFIYFSLTRPNK